MTDEAKDLIRKASHTGLRSITTDALDRILTLEAEKADVLARLDLSNKNCDILAHQLHEARSAKTSIPETGALAMDFIVTNILHYPVPTYPHNLMTLKPRYDGGVGSVSIMYNPTEPAFRDKKTGDIMTLTWSVSP